MDSVLFWLASVFPKKLEPGWRALQALQPRAQAWSLDSVLFWLASSASLAAQSPSLEHGFSFVLASERISKKIGAWLASSASLAAQSPSLEPGFSFVLAGKLCKPCSPEPKLGAWIQFCSG